MIPQIDSLAEERVVLHGIVWETFEQLLHEAGCDRNTRFYYFDGTLEIMAPLSRHEGSNRFIESLISAIAQELDLNLRKVGAMTLKRRDRSVGGEPDSVYYLTSEPLIRHKEDIDLSVDPPPDLILEIDITSPSDRRFPIYASLGIPELWKCDGRTLQYYVLQDRVLQDRVLQNRMLPAGHYQAVEQSPTFPWLPAAVIVKYLALRLEIGETQAIRQFRQWVRQAK
ncbi:MAG: Uma2 family endonuclease [Leptolyngbya sp. SIO4C1]|nr:Uma2 family endonuclease [Leptolyngbya sp. SIO4C1]